MRLDLYLTKNKYFKTRTKATQSIERGEVYVNNVKIVKSSYNVNENKNNDIKIVATKSFVSLGGYKLDKALSDFNYLVKDKIAYDIGSSTGGFSDCLLQNDIKKIYAVDLNDDLLDETIKSNDKVTRIIKNVKNLDNSDFLDKPDLIVADLSFISADCYLSILSKLLPDDKDLILIIKPQFEQNERIKLKNGIIKDKKIIINTCKKIYKLANYNNLGVVDITPVPFLENKNIEYLTLMKKNNKNHISLEEFLNKL